MLNVPLTEEQRVTISEMIDDLAMDFLERLLDPRRKEIYIRTIVNYSAFGFTFEKLCQDAFPRTHERWNRPGQMPPVNFILGTIDARTW